MHNAPSVILYHYTSGDGLLGIFAKDSLWATKIHFMNDYREFKHASELAVSQLHGLREGRKGDKYSQLAVAAANHVESLKSIGLFVACFSEDYDSLSQWRGYCPRSFGYNVGFDADVLRSIAREQGFELRQCVYERDVQQATVSKWATDTVVALAASCPDDADPREFTSANCNSFLRTFISFAPYLKDSAFRDEREWRLVGVFPSDDSRIALRSGRGTLVPYLPINLRSKTDGSPIWEIRVGPTPHMDLAMDAMSQLFNQAKVKNGITRTLLPYRDW